MNKQIMKILWIIILFMIMVTFSSCAIVGESRKSVCRHKTAMAALVYSEHYLIRIVYGPSDKKGKHHCMAQAYIDGRWHFLNVFPPYIDVTTGGKDCWFIVKKKLDLETFLYKFWFNKGYGGSLEEKVD